MIKYEIDENQFLTGNHARTGAFEHYIELDKELEEVNLNMKWNGLGFIMSVNPKQIQRELQILREKREKECFSVINRGYLWYATLTAEQKQELESWYHAWLDVTETKIVPQKLEWIK